MQVLARFVFAIVIRKARRGLLGEVASDVSPKDNEPKREDHGTGALGARHAHWYGRRLGCIFLAWNYTPVRCKWEIDLAGKDGKTLALLEVRPRAAVNGRPALPELSITREKHEVLARPAKLFLRDWHFAGVPGVVCCGGGR